MVKKTFFSLVMVVMVLGVILIGAEIILRVLKGVPDSPLALITQDEENKRYLFEPNSEFTSRSSMEGEFEYTAHINSHGYRGKEFSAQKPEGLTRILAMGDSFTFGVGSRDDETFAAFLEQGLTQKGVAAEVINAGIGHVSTIRHWDNLQKIHLRYQPDIVVLFFDMTDLWDDWHWERHAIWDAETGTIKSFDLDYYWGKRNWWAAFVHRSALCKYLENKIVRPFKKLQLLGLKRYLAAAAIGERAKSVIINSPDEFPDDVVMEYDGLLLMRGRSRKGLIDKHWERTARYLKKIHELLSQQGIEFVIVMYPHGIYAGADQWNDGRQPWGFEQGKQYTDYYPFELMEEFAHQEGIVFVNTLPGFLDAPGGRYFFNWDGHMTPEGNRIVADQILSSSQFQDVLTR